MNLTRLLALLVLLVAASLGLAAQAPAPAPAPDAATAQAAPAAETVDLTLLHINDVHGQTEPTTLGPNRSIGGYARLSTLVQETRAEKKGTRVLLVHAGDELSRGDDLTRATLGAANVAIMNLIGFDVWTPGNGDYYDGLDVLQARIREFKGSVLAANVKVKTTGRPLARSYVIEQAGPVRIAFVGLCFLQPLDESYATYDVASPAETVKALVPELRKQADVVVAVTHLGVAADYRLAEAVDGLDLIIGAHSHTVLRDGVRAKGPSGREVLIAQAGEQLVYCGRIDLRLEKADGGYRLVSSAARLITLDQKIKLDPAVTALIAEKSKPPAPAARAEPLKQEVGTPK
jgi:2',3'-cyclic-nucleotide 2'-phosphodiesterase (5'-nucleotidase family)